MYKRSYFGPYLLCVHPEALELLLEELHERICGSHTRGRSLPISHIYYCGPLCCELVLIQDDNGLQKLVYYVSKSLHEAEVRYLPLEKGILAVVHATQKLPYYFQAHTVVVLTQLPLKSVLQTADYTGRIAI